MSEKKKKFLLDENLYRLTKWLRMLGYDSIIPKSISIEKKISLCQKERRIFLTRSKKIANRNNKFIRILIKTEEPEKQLQQILNLIDFDEDIFASRCLICNNRLEMVTTKKIESLVPENVKNTFSDFKICRKCGKIYWKGSHYVAMKSRLKNLLTT